jgi:hypothetical protein
MRRRWVALLVAILVTSAFSAESESGSVCVAPAPEKPDSMLSPDAGIVCKPEKLSLRIDTQPAVSWPTDKSLKINALDSTTRHRVVVLCDGKPRQSFTFWFSSFKTTALCLFIGGYDTLRLREVKECPWCKCK